MLAPRLSRLENPVRAISYHDKTFAKDRIKYRGMGKVLERPPPRKHKFVWHMTLDGFGRINDDHR